MDTLNTKDITPADMKSKKGYFGIGVYHPKTTENIGTLWRAAYLYGADFIFTIGRRYKKQPSDTVNTFNKIPLYNYPSYKDFYEHIPYSCQPVFVEQLDGSRLLKETNHPKQVVYVLGAEDHGIPAELMKNHQVIEIESLQPESMNVAMAGTLVMYDRFIKSK